MTLKNIAKELNLSINTISDVLNGGDQRYSAATRQRIFETADRLGYRPNRQAQLLAGAKSGIIGVIKSANLHQPAIEMILSAGQLINEAGYQSLSYELISHRDQISRAFQVMIDARVEGVIIEGVPDFEEARSEVLRLGKAKIPAVCMGGQKLGEIPQIRADLYHAGRMLTAHLLQKHRRFVMLVPRGPLRSHSVQERMRGVKEEVIAQGGNEHSVRLVEIGRLRTQLDTTIDYAGTYYEPSRLAMRKLIESGELPDAVICSNDAFAIGAIKACSELGVDVPGQLGIVGFDDTALCNYLTPSLTSIASPSRLIAERAVETLLAMIGKKKTPISAETMLPCTLRVRESCGVAAT